jgi:hypothetical protein
MFLLLIFTTLFISNSNNSDYSFWTAEYTRQQIGPVFDKPVIQEADIYSFMDKELKFMFYTSSAS